MDYQDSNFSIKSEEEEDDVLVNDNDSTCMILGSNEEEEKTEELFELLKNWNQLELFEHFRNEKIDLEVLSVIKPHHFERLLEPFDLRTHIMFEHNIQLWRDSIGQPLLQYPENPSNFGPHRYRRNSISKSLKYIGASNQRTFKNRSLISVKEFTPSNSTPITTINAITPASASSSTLATESTGPRVTLENILKTTVKGKMLLDVYEKNKKFEEVQRTLLIHLIAEYFNDKGIHLELSATYNIEKEIIAKFPSEQLVFYRTSKRGRIYNKYCNYKYSLIKVARSSIEKGNSSINGDSKEEELLTFLVPEEDAEQNISLLKNAKLSLKEIENCWKACTKFRINEIRTNSLPFILKKWPQFKSPNGPKFITMDFQYLEPNWNSLVTNWNSVYEKLFIFLRQGHNIKSHEIKAVLNNIEANPSKDCRDAALLWCLHGYLKPTLRISGTDDNGKKSISKISIKDSQDSFVYVANSVQHIEKHRQIVNRQNNNSTNPFIAVLGTDIENFNSIFVCFEDIKYPVDSFVNALDLCYNIFFLFKLEYPTACKAIWSFIQNMFYETKEKTHFPRVHVLINELRNK